jgi:hypothetical protein
MVLGDEADGIFVGTATDTEYIPIKGFYARGFNSNVLFEEDFLFFASREKLAKIDKNSGEVLWGNSLDKKKMGRSIVFRQDSTLYLINKAYINFASGRYNTGEAFFAAFDERTGQKRFEIATDRKGISIRDYVVNESSILLLYENRIAKYSLIDGSLITEKYYIFKDDDRLRYFADDKYYTESGQFLFCIPKINPDNIFVRTKKKNIIAFGENLKKGETFQSKDIYVTNFIRSGFKFISQKGKMLVLDNRERVVARLTIPSDAIFSNNREYFAKGRKIIEVDLEEVMEE